MNAEGRYFLIDNDACGPGLRWALEFPTLEDAWNHCETFSWMWWALDYFPDLKERARRATSADDLRKLIGNPFTATPEERRCLRHNTLRCRECLIQVGLPA